MLFSFYHTKLFGACPNGFSYSEIVYKYTFYTWEWYYCPTEMSAMVERALSVLSKMMSTSHMWLLST